MFHRHRSRRGFTHRDLLAVLVVCLTVFTLGAPALSQFGFRSKRVQCTQNMRQLGLAMHTYHAARHRFPLTSDSAGPLDKVAPAKLGEDAGASAGYSHLVQILPNIERFDLLNELWGVSDEFEKPPAHPDVLNGKAQSVWAVKMELLRCPSNRGATVETAFSALVDGEPADVKTEYAGLKLHGDEVPATTHYVAVVGTHWDKETGVVENGLLTSRCARREEGKCVHEGTRFGDVKDGLRHTILLTESVEPAYAAWIDGQSTWVVGIDSNKKLAGVGTAKATAEATALNLGPDPKAEVPAPNYSHAALGGEGWPGQAPRRHGPGSRHFKGIINHLFGDGSIRPVTPDIDATVYYRLVTMAGGEEVEHE